MKAADISVYTYIDIKADTDIDKYIDTYTDIDIDRYYIVMYITTGISRLTFKMLWRI